MFSVGIKLIPKLLHHSDQTEGGRPWTMIGPNLGDKCGDEFRSPSSLVEWLKVVLCEGLLSSPTPTGGADRLGNRFRMDDLDR
jgi:hypothetical protein